MSSETITRNDLTAILNEVLPPTASEYRTLLWTNPNPTANFNASTILSNTNLAKYNEVEIEWLYNNSSITTNGSRKRITVGNGSILQSVGGTGGSGSGAITIVTRTCTVNTNNIVFGDAYLGYDGQAMSSGYNHNLIPYKIYGIQYERVNPPQAEIVDVVVEQGTATATGTGVTGGSWQYRKWSSGRVEAWAGISYGNQTGSVWVSPIYYKDLTVTIPSGIFSIAPAEIYVTGGSAQWFAVGTSAHTTTSFNIRMATCASSAQALVLRVYAVSFV